jgi:hypothetical protein
MSNADGNISFIFVDKIANFNVTRSIIIGEKKRKKCKTTIFCKYNVIFINSAISKSLDPA